MRDFNKAFIIIEVTDKNDVHINHICTEGYNDFESAEASLLDIGCVEANGLYYIDNLIYSIKAINVNKTFITPSEDLRIVKMHNKRRYRLCFIARIKSSKIPIAFDTVDKLLEDNRVNHSCNFYKVLVPGSITFINGETEMKNLEFDYLHTFMEIMQSNDDTKILSVISRNSYGSTFQYGKWGTPKNMILAKDMRRNK